MAKVVKEASKPNKAEETQGEIQCGRFKNGIQMELQ